MDDFETRKQKFLELQAIRDQAESALLKEYLYLKRDFPDDIEKSVSYGALHLYWVS